jgi:dTDP-4-dehydrorhamnose reductase
MWQKSISAKLIHISTDYVFDGKAFLPYSESDEVNPKSVYGETKLAGEQNCLKENPDSIVIRTSWLYSTFGNNFVKTMLVGKERESVKVVFDQVGTPTYAADLAKAQFFIIQNFRKKPENLYPEFIIIQMKELQVGTILQSNFSKFRVNKL